MNDDDESATIDDLVERVVHLEAALEAMVAALKSDLVTLRHDLVKLKRARTPAPPQRPPTRQSGRLPAQNAPRRTISEELALKTAQRDPRSEK